MDNKKIDKELLKKQCDALIGYGDDWDIDKFETLQEWQERTNK